MDKVQIFDGTPVSLLTDGSWSYGDPKRYWVPNCKYKFWAISPDLNYAESLPEFKPLMDGRGANIVYNEDGFPSYEFSVYKNNCTTDYIIAQTGIMATSDKPVELEFHHIFSKVKMSFTNNVDPYVNMEVSNITINSPQTGNLVLDNDFTKSKWSYSSTSTSTNGETLPSFNNVSGITPGSVGETGPLFLIPTKSNYVYNITFNVTLKMNDVEAPLRENIQITGQIKGKELLMGCSYNLTTTITPSSIETGCTSFEVKHIPYWDTPDADGNAVFSDEEKILIASKLSGEVTLKGDAEFSNCVEVVDSLTINLNAHKIEYLASTGYLFNVYRDDNDNYTDGDKTILTINGNNNDASKIISNNIIATVGENSSMIINGGKYITTSSTTIYASNGGKIEITKGSFESTLKADSYTLLSGSVADITVRGGSFYRWNPQNYLASTNNEYTNYVVVENKPKTNWYYVTKQQTVTNSGDGSKDNFDNAISDPDVTIIDVTTNINHGENQFSFNNRGEVILNMNDHNLTGVSGSYAGSVVNNTHLTVNGGKFTVGGFTVKSNSTLILNNCSIDLSKNGSTSGRYCVYLNSGGKVIVNGGSFKITRTNKFSYICADGGNSRGFVLYADCANAADQYNNTWKELGMYENGTGDIIIYGGTYKFDPSKWISSQSTVSDPVNGVWTVTSNGIKSTKDDNEYVTTVISSGTFEFDPSPWLASGAIVTEATNEAGANIWIVSTPAI